MFVYISSANIAEFQTNCFLCPGMKEDDISDLLKFERKMLRGRISTLRSDKFLQTRLKMETVDGKSQKVNYYYINYKV